MSTIIRVSDPPDPEPTPAQRQSRRLVGVIWRLEKRIQGGLAIAHLQRLIGSYNEQIIELERENAVLKKQLKTAEHSIASLTGWNRDERC